MRRPKLSAIAQALLPVVLVGGAITLVCRHVLAEPPAEILSVMLLGGDRPAVAVYLTRSQSGRHSTTSHQVYAFDLATGERTGDVTLATVSYGDPFEMFPHAGDRAWANRGGELELVDLRRASVVYSGDDLDARVPMLAGGYEVTASVTPYDPPMHAVPVTLHDGSRKWIDMTPRALDAPPPPDPWLPGYFCAPDAGEKASCRRQACIGFATVPGTTALVLGTAPVWPNHVLPIAASDGATRLLRPGLVNLAETKCAFELDRAVLVMHDSAAMVPRESLLSLVDADGKARWTIPLSAMTDHPRAEAMGAFAVGDAIDVVLSEDHQTLDVVELTATGAVRTRHPLL